mmetsp:Transcript_22979/g.54427  ORF Transcript_22979/g.54427 Transcript_22979/m.54427 type:complete len:273 (-) Transcript_22979:382-1200(-)
MKVYESRKYDPISSAGFSHRSAAPKYQKPPSIASPSRLACLPHHSACSTAPNTERAASMAQMPRMSRFIRPVMAPTFSADEDSAEPPPRAPPADMALVSTPVLTTSPKICSVLRSWQPRSSMLPSVTADTSAGALLPRSLSGSRCSMPAKSLQLPLGASHRSAPRSRSSVAHASQPAALSRAKVAFAASRSFESVSPSSDLVLTQQCDALEPLPVPRKSMSAGKISRLRTHTTSPTRTSSQRCGSKAPVEASSTRVASELVSASERRRCQSS